MEPILSLPSIDVRQLFEVIYNAGTEQELDSVIAQFPGIFNNPDNWKPLGGNENSFGVIENQQSSPIASIIEKITNSIDALLMKRCLELGIDPKSEAAPQSIDQGIKQFYPEHKEWEIFKFRRQQSEEIQIIADGVPGNTSVIIYDNGEGQHPKNFEDTFLSLLRGNKNEIHFVQGKYNMGGSGAIVFCGKKRYQLIASKRFDGNGNFGFTLIRQHQLTKDEEKTKKNTWYEYLVIGGEIPNFQMDELDLKLHKRRFVTGTIIKLYSYQFPTGYYGFAQDLNQSINEFLFEPALPVLTVDNATRYPKNNVLELDLYGLKRRLDEDEDYVDDKFSVEFDSGLFGKLKVSCFIFKAKAKGFDVQKTKERIRDRYFKNRMSVMFSLNGQVQGHYTSEFITRSLKMNILKDYLLINVDCTNMDYNFRKELFMASRDRLKEGDETRQLRKYLADKLGGGRLAEIEKKRKASITVSGENTQELLKNFTQNMPMSEDLKRLLGGAFKLDAKPKEKPKAVNSNETSSKKEAEVFRSKRFPTYLKVKEVEEKGTKVAKIPLGGEKTLKFETDVQNDYFDRIDEPGALKFALLNFTSSNEAEGGDASGKPEKIEDVFDVEKTSPADGKIRVVFRPKKDVKVGDAIQVRVSLDAPGEALDQIFWVKIAEPNGKPQEKPKQEEQIELPGLPTPVLVYRVKEGDKVSWDEVEQATGEPMSYENIMYPMVSGELLERIYINMNSNVLLNFKSKQKTNTEEQNELADKKYISSVYFHTLFLYTIIKRKNYSITREVEGHDEAVDLGTYLCDVFDSYYSEFILHFGTVDLLAALGN